MNNTRDERIKKMLKRSNLYCEMENEFEWREWTEKIPKLSFKEDWEVKIIPPFGGAIARFTIDKNDNYVSVYLDCYDTLGCVGEPYWEVYDNNDTVRFLMEETKELLDYIDSVLER